MDLLGITPETLNIETENFEEKDGYDSFLIIQQTSLCKFFVKLCCPQCKFAGVVFQILKGKCLGFAVKATISCPNCNEIILEEYLSERLGGVRSTRAPFEVNTRTTMAFMRIGSGYAAMQDWGAMMNLASTPNKAAYHSIKDRIVEGNERCFAEVRAKSVEAIKCCYKDIGVVPDKEGIRDVAVSYDGTWQRRGHSSHNGIGIAIDLLT